MTTDFDDKILLTASFDRTIDAGEGQKVARDTGASLREIDPEVRLSASWLDVQPGRTTVHMTFTPADKLREALMPLPPDQWPKPGEVMSLMVSDRDAGH